MSYQCDSNPAGHGRHAYRNCVCKWCGANSVFVTQAKTSASNEAYKMKRIDLGFASPTTFPKFRKCICGKVFRCQGPRHKTCGWMCREALDKTGPDFPPAIVELQLNLIRLRRAAQNTK